MAKLQASNTMASPKPQADAGSVADSDTAKPVKVKAPKGEKRTGGKKSNKVLQEEEGMRVSRLGERTFIARDMLDGILTKLQASKGLTME